MLGGKLARFAYIEGLDKLLKLIQPPDILLAEPWKEAMKSIAKEGVTGARVSAPRRTGRLAQKIYAGIQRKPFPMWAAVRSRARSGRTRRYPKGYSYPRLLNYSPRHGHQLWFDRGVHVAVDRAPAVLAEAGDDIANRWQRGGK